MAEYNRPPQGWRFEFAGVCLRDVPDALTPNKYSAAKNIRASAKQGVQTRPGYVSLFNTGAAAVTDLRAYAALGTDNLPRFLARDTGNAIYLDTGALIATLTGVAGSGVSMLPFRPAQSPQAWMYVSSLEDYRKFSAPDAGGAVVAQKVGIAEPLSTTIPTLVVEAAPLGPTCTDFTGVYTGWTAGGTASGISAVNLFTDTAGTVLTDPALSTRKSVKVVYVGLYMVGMEVIFAAINQYQVQAVLPACAAAIITNVLYYVGSSGPCQITLSTDISGSLQRGSIVHLVQGGNNEDVLVLSAIKGPGNTCAFECSTAATYTGGTVSGVGAIVVDGAPVAAQAITSPTIHSNMTAGIGYISQTLASNPFAAYSQDDYVHVLLLLNNIAAISKVDIIFNTGNTGGAPDYVTSTLTYSVTGAALADVLVAGDLAQISFPVSALTDFAGMPASVNGIRISVTSTDWTTLVVGSVWMGGKGGPDIGETGIPYKYRVVPRSSLTGAKGNASAPMRYAVSPRRQQVKLVLPSAAYDSQIDTWDIYRYGGSVTSYRYLGSVPSSASTYIDDLFDDAVLGGTLLETDNFEPWPSIDAPFRPTSPAVTISGTFITVAWTGTWPVTILRWLPGTLLAVGGVGVFTLRARPLNVNSTTYMFEVTECGGYSTGGSYFIVSEPIVARQPVPYAWGPNEQGDVFAVGDTLRPGTVYFAKSYQPDSAPDSYNLDLTPPSEPLLGGTCLRGVSLVASTQRWWALYPAFTTAQRYNAIEQSIGRGLVSPYGHCSDGQRIYFWAKDGIVATEGGSFQSLTDADLYPLFPHEGVTGANITRNGVTFYAPDYKRAATFRLAVAQGFLYADYQDSTGTPRTLVCDLRTGGWQPDIYGDPIRVHYAVEQQEGTLGTGAPALYPMVVLADTAGKVYKQQDLANDDGMAIACLVATFEWDGGDPRSQPQWGDLYLDCLPITPVTATPMSLSAAVGAATVVAAAATRTFSPISAAGGVLKKFLGLQLAWTDDFTTQSAPTALYLWQPSLVPKPETTKDRFGDWEQSGAAYYRGFVLSADTFNLVKSLGIRNGDNNALVTFPIQHNGQQEIGYAFAAPFVAHLIRHEAQDAVPWRYFGIKWISDPWPELIAERTPWINLGTPGAKYMRGLVVPIDTNGLPITLTLVSSDGASVAMGPYTTLAAVKTPTAIALTIPLIGHEFQIRPSGPCRIWTEEIRWDYDLWPELISEATGWLKVSQDSGASFLQGFVAPIEAGGAAPTFNLLTDAGGTIALTSTVTPAANVKTAVPFSLVTPAVVHEVQLVPSAPCRIWLDEIRWVAQPTAELAITWKTQFTAHGLSGYQHVYRIEAAYASTAPVMLTITSYDGSSPTVIVLPATGGAYRKAIVNLTPNKGTLYQYSATSWSPFQMFLNDFLVWVGLWGRPGNYVPYRLIGSEAGDGARI
jgi:hypothetical protein